MCQPSYLHNYISYTGEMAFFMLKWGLVFYTKMKMEIAVHELSVTKWELKGP